MSKLVKTNAYLHAVVTQDTNIVWEFPHQALEVQLTLFLRAEQPVDCVLSRHGEKLFRFFLDRGSSFGPVTVYREDFEGVRLMGYPRDYHACVEIQQQSWAYESVVDAIGAIR
jgi:hypothetical protein